MSTDAAGVFRRRILADATEHCVEAAVEDDFHHYDISLKHDGTKVAAVEGRAQRTPYSTCPGALARLKDIVGLPISSDIVRMSGLPDPRQQCTHWFELALVAIGQAARGGRRQYDIEIPDRVDQTPYEMVDGKIVPKGMEGHGSARLHRNGELLLDWRLEGETIVAPEEFAGQTLRRMVAWAAPRFDDDMLEAIKVLRRGLHVSGGRNVPMGTFKRADSMVDTSLGACFVFQPERVGEGIGLLTRLDFTRRPQDLLVDRDSNGGSSAPESDGG